MPPRRRAKSKPTSVSDLKPEKVENKATGDPCPNSAEVNPDQTAENQTEQTISNGNKIDRTEEISTRHVTKTPTEGREGNTEVKSDEESLKRKEHEPEEKEIIQDSEREEENLSKAKDEEHRQQNGCESPSTKKPKLSLPGKRTDYLQWQDYFMSIAFLSAQRSKDPSSQVGACIVNKENKIVGIGYNGFPRGCNDDEFPWKREGDSILDTKYPYVCHAEVNAVLNKNSSDVKDCSIYVALFPCNECAKIIVQSGIKEVVYYSDKYHERPEVIASKRMFDVASVVYRQYQPKQKQILIDFTVIEKNKQKPSSTKRAPFSP